MFLHNVKTLAREGVATVTSRANYTPIDNFFERDWDNLLILDGCRYDALKDRNPFDEAVTPVFSNASHTREFIRKNLKPRDNSDIVYVTASPQIARRDLGFHERIDVWDTDWDEHLGTVPPEPVSEAVADAVERYPHKRIVGHYLQPHCPFIATDEGLKMGRKNEGSFLTKDHLTVWERIRTGELTEEEVRREYRANLTLVLEDIEHHLLDQLPGKTVITSDHGNSFGSKIGWVRVYGHGYGWKDPSVTKVGWVELMSGGRRDITAEPEKRSESAEKETDDEAIKEKLQQLGYHG